MERDGLAASRISSHLVAGLGKSAPVDGLSLATYAQIASEQFGFVKSDLFTVDAACPYIFKLCWLGSLFL